MINRFYNPSRGQYISQFVPKQLPAEALMRGLLNKQTLADKRQAEMDATFGDWTHPALGWYDTNYVKDWGKKLEDFTNKAMEMDKTSPEFQREYSNLLRTLKKDEGLAKVKASYDTHQRYLKRMEELIDKNEYAAARELSDEYRRAYDIYTQEGGLGYTGTTMLEDPLIKQGVNKQDALEQFVDQVGEDSYQSMRSIADGMTSSDIYYSITQGGKSKNKLHNAISSQLGLLYDSPVGQQLKAEYRMNHIPLTLNGKKVTQAQYLNSLSDEDRKAFHEAESEFVVKTALGVANTFITSKFSTTQAEAYNTRGGLQREKELENGPTIYGIMPGENIQEYQDLSLNKAKENINSHKAKLEKELEDIRKNPHKYEDGAEKTTLSKIQQEVDNLAALEKYQKSVEDKVRLEFESAESRAYKEKVLRQVENTLATIPKDLQEKMSGILLRSSMKDMPTYKNGVLQPATLRTPEMAQQDLQREMKAAGISMEQFNKYQEAINTKNRITQAKNYINAKVAQKTEEFRIGEDGGPESLVFFQGTASVPTYKGSTAYAENKMINQKFGYTFEKYDETTGKYVEVDPTSLGDMEITSTTTGAWKNRGIARNVTGIQYVTVQDKNGFDKLVPKPVSLVVTPNSPQSRLVDAQYAAEAINSKDNYLKMAQKATDDENFNLADKLTKIAYQEGYRGLSYLSPELAGKFQEARRSGNFGSGVVNITTPTGEVIDAVISRNAGDGTIEMTLSNVVDDNGKPIKVTKSNLDEAEFFLESLFIDTDR